MTNQLHLKISGQVTGVNFRYTTRQLANQLNLTGWVKNCPDNTVEILAQGEEKNLHRLLKWVKQGPKYAQVDKVEIEWLETKNNFTDFRIEH